MRRFIVSPSDISGAVASLKGSEAHHLRHVLRLKTGSRVTLFDGTGSTYEGEITSMTAGQVLVIIEKVNRVDTNRPRLHLGQALIAGKKFDLIVQKATELGIDSLTPYTSTFCSSREPSAHKQDRWLRIASESCKQCARAIPPRIDPIACFGDCIAGGAEHDLRLIFWEEKADLNLHDIETVIRRDQPGSVFFMIGPEGGLSDEEVEIARQHGFRSVTLGRQILRAETATMAAGAILQFLLGNMD